jgi:hypothetical protein
MDASVAAIAVPATSDSAPALRPRPNRGPAEGHGSARPSGCGRAAPARRSRRSSGAPAGRRGRPGVTACRERFRGSGRASFTLPGEPHDEGGSGGEHGQAKGEPSVPRGEAHRAPGGAVVGCGLVGSTRWSGFGLCTHAVGSSAAAPYCGLSDGNSLDSTREPRAGSTPVWSSASVISSLTKRGDPYLPRPADPRRSRGAGRSRQSARDRQAAHAPAGLGAHPGGRGSPEPRRGGAGEQDGEGGLGRLAPRTPLRWRSRAEARGVGAGAGRQQANYVVQKGGDPTRGARRERSNRWAERSRRRRGQADNEAVPSRPLQRWAPGARTSIMARSGCSTQRPDIRLQPIPLPRRCSADAIPSTRGRSPYTLR